MQLRVGPTMVFVCIRGAFAAPSVNDRFDRTLRIVSTTRPIVSLFTFTYKQLSKQLNSGIVYLGLDILIFLAISKDNACSFVY